MTPLPKGTKVVITGSVLEGEILFTETNGDEFGYRVGFEMNGELHERFFSTTQIHEKEGE